MDPLRTVENILGSIETWPSTVIVDLFITKPCTISVKMLLLSCTAIAFLWKTVDCSVACVGIDSYYASCAVKDWFTTWDNLPHKTHFPSYYSMAFKRWMWLNGKYAA